MPSREDEQPDGGYRLQDWLRCGTLVVRTQDKHSLTHKPTYPAIASPMHCKLLGQLSQNIKKAIIPAMCVPLHNRVECTTDNDFGVLLPEGDTGKPDGSDNCVFQLSLTLQVMLRFLFYRIREKYRDKPPWVYLYGVEGRPMSLI